jgi:putative copper resistance protein D
LRPPPADLAYHVYQHPDGQFFAWFTRGIPGTAMPAFAATLSEEDRWHVLNYINTFAPAPR